MSSYKTELIREGSAEITVPIHSNISKQMPVFYNPIMKLNRDLAVLFLKQFPPQKIFDPMAGTGIRAIRFAKEIKYKSIFANDLSAEAVTLMQKNMTQNNVTFNIMNLDANEALLNSEGFGYIDLDVFGCPNKYLDLAIKRISRSGILAVTATDTSALAGTYPLATARKYWAKPLRNKEKHELGMRILVRKIQLIGAQYEKALIPVFCHSSEHYYRAYLKVKSGKSEVDKILKKHKYFLYCSKCLSRKISMFNSGTCPCGKKYDFGGPLFVGDLWQKSLLRKMLKSAKENPEMKKAEKLLTIILEEARIKSVGFIDIHRLAKIHKKPLPPMANIITTICENGYSAARTHFNPHGLRTNAPLADLVKIIKK